MLILSIETSCDETAAAVVEDGTKVLSSIIASSVNLHAKTGGVVPEVAAREHIRQIIPVVDQALEEAKVNWVKVDAIAVTEKPGLVASLLVGINTAYSLAYIHKKPLIKVNHIHGHLYSNFLDRTEVIEFPILILTVSGGHNELVLMRGHHDFEIIGETLDDAAGEAFDKVARMLNLGFPGGPAIARAAEKGNATAYNLPRAMLDKNRLYDFSFSGLKTAVRTLIQQADLSTDAINNIAASFQQAVVDVLSDKLIKAAEAFQVKAVHLSGGVSANQLLRQVISEKLNSSLPFYYPKNISYCTDNAAMIGCAAYFQPFASTIPSVHCR